MSSDGNLSITPWGYYMNPKTHPYWQTDDIWVDNNGNGIQESDEPAIGKSDNHLFARITNNGGAPSGPFDVTFSYVPFTGVIDMANKQHITTVSRASLPDGNVDEVEVLWDLTSIPPAFSGINHFCVIAEIESDECAGYDNQAQNNFNNVPTVGPSPAPLSLYIKNILPTAATGKLIIEPQPTAWQYKANVPDIEAIPLQPNEEKLITVEFSYKKPCNRKELTVSTVDNDETDICAKQQFDISYALEGDILGGVSSEIVVHYPSYKRSISVHAGTAIPVGDFDTLYKPGVMLGLDVDYHLSRQVSLVGLLGYNEFKADTAVVSDTYWLNASLNGKFEFTTNPIRPYLNGGLGIYIPESGSSEPGLNLGIGVLRNLTPQYILSLGADYHHIFTSGEDIEFYTAHLGVIFMF